MGFHDGGLRHVSARAWQEIQSPQACCGDSTAGRHWPQGNQGPMGGGPCTLLSQVASGASWPVLEMKRRGTGEEGAAQCA